MGRRLKPPPPLPGQPLPHDLLRLRHVPQWQGAPAWVVAALAQLPVVVVRRAAAPCGAVSVGVRGVRRDQRFGAEVHRHAIAARVSPDALVFACPPPLADATVFDMTRQSGLPAFVALRGLSDELPAFGFAWGPTGSVGFELASGVPAVHAHSDLDLILRVPQRLSHATALLLEQTLARHAEAAGVRIDAQLETPAGAVALAEYARGARRVLLRTGTQPVMVEDPWDACGGVAEHAGAGVYGAEQTCGAAAGRQPVC